MGFLSHWHAPRGANADGVAKRPQVWDDFWYRDAAGFVTGAGARVNGDRALTLPPFWRGVRILSENLASFKCQVYERLDRGRKPAPLHSFASALGTSANPHLTAFEFWECMVAHMAIRSRAFALKRVVPDPQRSQARLELWPLHPDRVSVARTPGRRLSYEVRDENGGPAVKYGSADIFHVRGISMDGIDGASMIAYAAESLGGAMAAEKFAHRFFKTGVTAAVQAVSPTTLGDEGLRNLRASIQAYVAGLDNAFGVYVAEDGVELKPIGVEPEKSQLLETRGLTAKQVAQWLNLPPGMLGETDTPTYASGMQFRQDLVDLTFRPLAERLEARIDHDLLAGALEAEDAPDRFFAKFELDSLLRGAIGDRYKAHETGIRAGFKTRNEVRLEEDMEPLDGLDEPIFALNMGSGAGAQADQDTPAGRAAAARETRATRIVLQECEHLVREEVAAVRKLAQRHADDGHAWQAALREFYPKHAEKLSHRLCLPLVVAREYAARQGLRLAEGGLAAAEAWEQTIPPQLATAALDPDAVTGRLSAQS